jgi:hypothetical protein
MRGHPPFSGRPIPIRVRYKNYDWALWLEMITGSCSEWGYSCHNQGVYLFIYLISFTVPQPWWLCRQKQKQKQKQKQTYNYEPETNTPKTNPPPLSGGFYPFGGWGPTGKEINIDKHLDKSKRKTTEHERNKLKTKAYKCGPYNTTLANQTVLE